MIPDKILAEREAGKLPDSAGVSSEIRPARQPQPPDITEQLAALRRNVESGATEPRRCRLCAPRIIAALALGGFALVLIGVRAAGGQPIWPPGYAYEHVLNRAIGARVGELVAIASAYVGAAFIVLAAVLFSYRLVRSSHRRQRGAH